jgi:Glycosyltransferase family 87
MLMVRLDRTRSDGVARLHGSGLDHRALAIAFAAFAAFAGLVAVFSGGDDGIWGAWAASGYAVTAVAVWRWPYSLAALLPALACGLAAPLVWLTLHAPVTSDVETVTRSAVLLLHHGTPYLPKVRLHRWQSYNPYLPAMAAFGMPKAAIGIPKAAGLAGLIGDPRPWLAVASAVVLAAAFGLGMPHRVTHCAACRGSAVRYAVLAVASPIFALSLAVGITDPPVLALMCLGLALTTRRSQPALAGLAIGVACAMKSIAWPALPVIAALLANRDGARAAARFCIVSLATAGALVVAMAPALLTRPSGFFQNTVAFPLGATRQHTPAASPLPGHLLAVTGPAGHAAAIGLLVVVALAVAVSLVVRPPGDTRAATWRLAVGLALFFALAPAARFGYFAYPGALLGWLAITARTGAEGPTAREAAATETVPAGAIPAQATPARATPARATPARATPARATPTGATTAGTTTAGAATTGAATTGVTGCGADTHRAAAKPIPAWPVTLPSLTAAKVRQRCRRGWRSRPATGNASSGS